MSWPATDFELAVEQELQALRKVARAACEAVNNVDDEWYRHELRHALDALPEEST